MTELSLMYFLIQMKVQAMKVHFVKQFWLDDTRSEPYIYIALT